MTPTRDRGSAPDGAPLLSVTVSNYNYARYLPENLDSILAQTFRDFELIVIDNASTDGSIDLLHQYAARDTRVRLILHDRNQSAITSFRESCDVARGRYRVHLDADDWIVAIDAFERQVAMLEANPAMTFCYSPMVLRGPGDDDVFVHRFYDGDQVLGGAEAVQKVLSLSLGHSGLMLRLDAYHRAGGYPDGFQFYDDVMLAARLCELGGVGYIDSELYGARQHALNENKLVDVDVIEREVLRMIDDIFAGPLGPLIPGGDATRRRLRRRALIHQPALHVFNDDRRIGWKLLLGSARRHPIETLVQPGAVAIVARTVLPNAAYQRLQRTLRRRGRTRTDPTVSGRSD